MKNPKSALTFIFITLLIDVIGIGIIIPVIPGLIMELTGSSISEASTYGGFLLFVYAFFQFIFAPILGGLSDRFGRRPVLLASLVGFGLDYLVLAMAPTWGWLVIGRVIAGILGASFTTASAYIADVSTPEKRSQNFGLIGAAFGLGFIIGPVLGGLLGEYGTRVPFYAAAILSVINAVYGFFILPESLPVEDRRPFEWKRANPLGNFKQFKTSSIISGLAIALFFVYIAGHAVHSTWTFFTMYRFEWDEQMVGYSLGLVGILSAIVQGGLIRWFIPKFGQKVSIYTGLGLYGLGLILFSFATQGWMMMVFLIPYCLGGISGPALQGIMSAQVKSNEQGELQGAMTSLMSLTSIIGPPLMTGIFAYFTSPDASMQFSGAPMVLAAFLCLIGWWISFRTLKSYKE